MGAFGGDTSMTSEKFSDFALVSLVTVKSTQPPSLSYAFGDPSADVIQTYSLTVTVT